MDDWTTYLEGGDLRSIAQVEKLVPLIQTQSDFDKLFRYLYSENRLQVMRAADAIEKITINKPELLTKHKADIIQLLSTANDKEFKWHLALLIPRLELSKKEFLKVWDQLSSWADDKKESKIVRVNSLQSLYDLSKLHSRNRVEFELLVEKMKLENIPSLMARLKKLGRK